MTETTNVPAPANGAVVKATPMDAMRLTLTKLEAEFSMALPPQIPVQKFIRTLMTAVQMNPALLEADRRSVLAGAMKAAQDGLLLDGREAVLVLYGKMAQYQPMIGGLLKKLRNSGELASVAAHVAYANDVFKYELGDEERIIHQPRLGGDRGEAIAAYAIARTKDGAVYREVMSVAEVEQVRSVSKAKNNGPWVQWWAEMARKTVLRRLCKRLPSSADIDQLIEHDNENSDLAQQAPDVPLVGAPNRLRASITLDDVAPREAPESTGGDEPPAAE